MIWFHANLRATRTRLLSLYSSIEEEGCVFPMHYNCEDAEVYRLGVDQWASWEKL